MLAIYSRHIPRIPASGNKLIHTSKTAFYKEGCAIHHSVFPFTDKVSVALPAATF